MNQKPTLELDQSDSTQLFHMIVDGARPADIFDTYDTNNAYYFIEAGIISNDLHEEGNIVCKVMEKLGGTMPDIPTIPERDIPMGIGGLEAKLIRQAKPSAIVTIRIGRNGEKEGFGFSDPMTMDQVMVGIDVETGEAREIDPSSPMPNFGGMGGMSSEMPAEIKQFLTQKLVGLLKNGGVENERITIKADSVSISGGKENVEVKIDGLELSGPPNVEELLSSIQEAIENAT